MSQGNKKKSMAHIATALVPPAAFTAVPNTPPPTPPPIQKNKRGFLRRKKKSPSPSPILPALIGVNLATRAIGLNLDTSSTRTSPDRSFYLRDASISSQEEFNDHSSLPVRGRPRKRQMGSGSREMVVEAEIQQAAAAELMEGRPMDSYDPRLGEEPSHDPVNMRPRRKGKKRRTPRGHSVDNSLELSDAHDLHERHRELEERVQLQNHETREMVRDVMMRQSAMEGGQHGSELSYDGEEFDRDQEALMEENSRLIKRNKGLVERNRDLHAVSELLKRHGKKGSPRSQVEAVLDENDILRVTIHRLNSELDRLQDKYGEPPSKGRRTKRPGSTSPEPKPKWLTDVEYLSPLFISYDAQIKEKDDIIQSLKSHGNEGDATKKKCNNLTEQNSLMVEEIQVLMEQIESLKKKASDTNKDHAREVAKLSKSVAIAEAELEVTKEEAQKVKEELSSLQRVHDKLVVESADKIPAREHVAAVNELKKEIEAIKDANATELAGLMKKIKGLEEEKSSLSLENTNIKVENKQLQGKLEALTRAYDKLNDKCEMLTAELEDTDRRNAECEAHLSEVIRLAEKTSAERDALAALAEKEQKMAEQALRKTMIGKWEMGKMEQTVRQYKKQAANQMNDISDKIRGLEESHQGRLQEYHREISHLRRILQRKQAMLDDVTEEKKQVENELENVWEAATSENRRIMDSLYKSKVLD